MPLVIDTLGNTFDLVLATRGKNSAPLTSIMGAQLIEDGLEAILDQDLARDQDLASHLERERQAVDRLTCSRERARGDLGDFLGEITGGDIDVEPDAHNDSVELRAGHDTFGQDPAELAIAMVEVIGPFDPQVLIERRARLHQRAPHTERSSQGQRRGDVRREVRAQQQREVEVLPRWRVPRALLTTYLSTSSPRALMIRDPAGAVRVTGFSCRERDIVGRIDRFQNMYGCHRGPCSVRVSQNASRYQRRRLCV